MTDGGVVICLQMLSVFSVGTELADQEHWRTVAATDSDQRKARYEKPIIIQPFIPLHVRVSRL